MSDFDYTPVDVAEALARLSGIAADKGCDGGVNAQQVQEAWQELAPHVGPSIPTLDPAVGERLKLLFDYIEGIILSNVAPDSFDVYEACFETLAKLGFCVPALEAKHMLFHCLEQVHEIYDMLLSCVETHEWLQPGATGLLRLWMLQALFAVFGQHTISGRDLMELTDNDVSGAISLIAFIVRCESAPFDMQAAAGRCLVELTAADSVFLVKTDLEETNTTQIAKLTAMLNKHVNSLIKALIQFEVVEAFARCICQHQQSHARTDIIVKHFLTTVHNCLLYCSENQRKFRQHLACQSTIVTDIMIPYVHNILPALYDNPNCGPETVEFANLKSVLQTFVVVTFNIGVFRPQLRDSDMLEQVCRVPNILNYISMLELLIKLSVNVDFVRGPYAEVLTQTFLGAFQALPAESQARLQRRLTSEQGMRLPFSRSARESVDALSFVLTLPVDEQEPGKAQERKARRQDNWRHAKNKARKRKRMFGMQTKDAAQPGQPECEAEEQEEDSADDMPCLIPAQNWEEHLGATDETFVPAKAKCQWTGVLMHDPVQTPDGFLFERAALEDWAQFYASNPLTGAPLDMAACIDAADVASFIQGYQMQMFAAGHLAPEAFEEPPPPEVAPLAPAAPMPAPMPMPAASSAAAASSAPTTLLGDLPSLGTSESLPSTKKREKGKIRIESRSVVDCPEDMRCKIDGKVMINPVLSPYGHHFEKKTLDKWLANCGSVCPITKKALRSDECFEDAEMKKRIVKFLKSQG